MASEFINIYKNNPTAGKTDGTLVSSDGMFTSPINFTFGIDQEQTLKLAIRTEAGCKTTGKTTIKVSETVYEGLFLQLCWEEDGFFDSEISTTDEITAVNKIFYARGSTATDQYFSKKITSLTLDVIYEITGV